MNFLQDNIQTILGPKLKRTPSGWMKLNCPMCHLRGEPTPDKLQRGGFMLDPSGSVGYHCFRCGFATKWEPGKALPRRLIKLLGVLGYPTEEIKRLQFEAMQQRRIHIPKEHEEEHTEFVEPTFSNTELPEGARPFYYWSRLNKTPPQFVKVAEYLYGRGSAVFNGFEYYWSPKRKNQMDWRFIIPFYYKDNLVGWTARYAGAPPNKGVPKYLSEQPADYLFNVDALYKPRREFVLLVEGVLDAIALDCVGALGNELSDKQKEWINTTNKRVIVLPDMTAGKATLADIGLEQNWSVSFPEWEQGIKDAADACKKYGRLYTLKSIIDSATSNKVKIGMNIKKYTKKR